MIPTMSTAVAGRPHYRFRAITVFSFLILFLNTGVFLGSAGNPIGIDGVQEAFYVFLIVWALGWLIEQQRRFGTVPKIDLFVFLIVPFLMVYSAFSAQKVYGQPYLFGLIEERRILAMFIYFPVVTMLRLRWVDIVQFERMVVFSGLICALLAIGLSLDLVPRIQETAGSEFALRGERNTVGASFVAVAIPFVIAARRGEWRGWAVPLILILACTLLFVMQTRQLMLASGIAALYLLRGPRAALILLGVAMLGYAAVLFLPGVSDRLVVLQQALDELTTEKYLTESWRGLAYSDALTALERGEIWGHGALSSLWNGGFALVFGPYFFLADIGIVGTFFRYGVIGVLVYFAYIKVQSRQLVAVPRQLHRPVYGAAFIFLVAAMPVGAPLEYRGNIAGLILGASAFLAAYQPRRSAS